MRGTVYALIVDAIDEEELGAGVSDPTLGMVNLSHWFVLCIVCEREKEVRNLGE